MDADREALLRRMHDVLDGAASAEERAQLDAALARDAEARAHFDELRRLFDALAAAPQLAPPASFVDDAVAAIARTRAPDARQLFARAGVIVPTGSDIRVRATGPTVANARTRSEPIWGSEHMSTSKRGLWMVGGVAAAIAVVLVAGVVDFPAKGDDATGAIVPAERHRAQQPGAADVKLIGGTQTATPAAPAQPEPGAQAARDEQGARAMQAGRDASQAGVGANQAGRDASQAAMDANQAARMQQQGREATQAARDASQAARMQQQGREANQAARDASQAGLGASNAARDASQAAMDANQAARMQQQGREGNQAARDASQAARMQQQGREANQAARDASQAGLGASNAARDASQAAMDANQAARMQQQGRDANQAARDASQAARDANNEARAKK